MKIKSFSTYTSDIGAWQLTSKKIHCLRHFEETISNFRKFRNFHVAPSAFRKIYGYHVHLQLRKNLLIYWVNAHKSSVYIKDQIVSGFISKVVYSIDFSISSHSSLEFLVNILQQYIYIINLKGLYKHL